MPVRRSHRTACSTCAVQAIGAAVADDRFDPHILKRAGHCTARFDRPERTSAGRSDNHPSPSHELVRLGCGQPEQGGYR